MSHRSGLFVCALGCLALLVTAQPGMAGVSRVLVLDATEADKTVANRSFSFEATFKDSAFGMDTVLDFLQAAEKAGGSSVPKALEKIRSQAGQSSTRWLSNKGDQLAIFVFIEETAKVRLSVDEKARDTQLSADVASLLKTIAKAPGGTIAIKESNWTLTRKRATLVARVDRPQVGTDAGTEKATPIAQATITTGPSEHWYLSTDVPITSIKQVTYNDNSNALEERDKPNKFLIGINFLVGDVLSDSRRFPSGLAVGMLVEGSNQPLRSLGISLSYRAPSWSALGIDLDSVSPFWALTRVTNDTQDSDGVHRNAHTIYRGQFGLALNLDKALGWLKPPKGD